MQRQQEIMQENDAQSGSARKMLPAAVQYGGRERFLLVWGDGSAVVFAGRFTGFLTGLPAQNGDGRQTAGFTSRRRLHSLPEAVQVAIGINGHNRIVLRQGKFCHGCLAGMQDLSLGALHGLQGD